MTSTTVQQRNCIAYLHDKSNNTSIFMELKTKHNEKKKEKQIEIS